MQGSTTSRPFPAQVVTSGDPDSIARYWQRVGAMRVKKELAVIKANTPRLISTVYERHVESISAMPTSNDLLASLTPAERRAVDQFAAMGEDGPTTDKMETFIMPVVTPSTAPTSPIRYIKYQRPDNPLVMLYGAIIAAIRAFGRPPDVLFLSASQEAALAGETERVTGKKYDGRFYMFDTRAVMGNLKSYPILTEDELPDQLMHDFKGCIEHDTVVAVVER